MFVGRSVPRREDARLLRGQGQFLADLELPGMLHVAFVRSPVAHARIRSVDTSLAKQSPGVLLALGGAELAQALPPVRDNQLPLPAKWKAAIPHRILNPRQPLLALDKARHVGEAVAVMVAETQLAAEDAAELVSVDLEELPAVVDPQAALADGSPIIHDRLKTNLIGSFRVQKGRRRTGARGGAPPHPAPLRSPPLCRDADGMPRRGRAYDLRTDTDTIWSSTQVVHWVRREAAATLGMSESRVRCIALDVGGGFGVKGHVYPEDLLLPFLAAALRPPGALDRRPPRAPDLLHAIRATRSTTSRSASTTKAASSRLRDHFIVDCGAWNPIGVGVVYNTAVHLPGPYKIAPSRRRGADRRHQQGAERALSRRRAARGGVQ